MSSTHYSAFQNTARRVFSRGSRTRLYWAAGALALALGSYALLLHFMQYTLLPHVYLLRYMYNLNFTFVPASGYLSVDGAMLLSADCIGAKLFVSAFLLLGIGFAPKNAGSYARLRHMLFSYGGTLFGALVLSIFRIALSLPFCYSPHAQLIHNILSLIIYFGSIIALYICAKRQVTANETSACGPENTRR